MQATRNPASLPHTTTIDLAALLRSLPGVRSVELSAGAALGREGEPNGRWHMLQAGALIVSRRLGRPAGIGVEEVVPGSPAAAAGLRSGDLILDVDGQAVADAGDLQRLMLDEAIGRAVRLRILRVGEVVELRAVPGELAA